MASADALAEMRRRYPEMSDWPDKMVSGLFETAVLDLHLRLRDLGRTFLTSLPFRR